MALGIERKFLVDYNLPDLSPFKSVEIDQGYLVIGEDSERIEARGSEGNRQYISV